MVGGDQEGGPAFDRQGALYGLSSSLRVPQSGRLHTLEQGMCDQETVRLGYERLSVFGIESWLAQHL